MRTCQACKKILPDKRFTVAKNKCDKCSEFKVRLGVERHVLGPKREPAKIIAEYVCPGVE